MRYNATRGRYEATIVTAGIKHTKTVPSPEPSERKKREAESELAKLVKQYGGTVAHRHTVASYMQDWLDFQESRVSWLTWRSHRSRINAHINPALGKLPLESLTAQRIDTLLTQLSKKLSPVTVQHVRKTLHAAMAQAERWELVARNPVSLVQAPRTPNVERGTLSPLEAQRFLDHVNGDRLEALWNIAACLGLRSGEVRGLTWEAIASGTLRVTQSLGYQPGQWDLHEPKTPKSRRTITLPGFIAAQLERRRETQKFEERTYGYSNPMGLIFTTPDGYPLSSQVLTKRLQALLEEAGLPRITFHQLRHLAASLMLSQGTPPRAVQETLGHATAGFTLSLYGHSDDAQRQGNARMLETWRTNA